jgi:hypothetical protein
VDRLQRRTEYVTGSQYVSVRLMYKIATAEWIDVRSAPKDMTANIEWLAFSLKLTDGEPGWLECITRPSLSLWLPLERRGRILTSAGSRVVVGGETGTLTIVDFPALA